MKRAHLTYVLWLLPFIFGAGFPHPARGAYSAAAAQLVSGSVLATNLGGDADSGLAILSRDGRFVLFASTANNLTLTNNNNSALPSRFNVYLRDTTSNTTMLVSVNASGTGGGNGDSFPTGLSTNGRFALFESSATDLAPNATNANDIFVRDVVNGTTTLVNVNAAGGAANGTSRESVLTPDGRYVAFTSAATNLVAGDTNNIPDVFVRDLRAGTTTLASVGAAAVSGATGSESPEITPDGRYVAFYSIATNLVPAANTNGDIYVRDLVAGKTYWASTNGRALFRSVFGNTNAACCNYSLSDDGRFVAYEAAANPPVSYIFPSSVNNLGLILRNNLTTGVTDIVYTNAAVQSFPFELIHNLSLTPDGRFAAFVANLSTALASQSALYLWDAQTGTNTLVSVSLDNVTPANGLCDSPVLSTNGRFVAFLSTGTNLVTNTLAGPCHLYLRDVQGGVTQLLDADANAVGAGVEPTVVPAISDDGSIVTFDGAGLLPANRHLVHDVFARNVLTGTPILVSAAHPALLSPTPDGSSALTSLSVSSNGQFIAFSSEADTLVANDTNGWRDVFVHDLIGGTNILVSVSTNGTASGDGRSTDPAISADGRYVAFTSLADNLVPGDTNQASDIFVRDLQAGITTLVSVSTNGVNSGNGASFAPSISADGRYVLFQSAATNLAADASAQTNLFFRDLSAATTYALTTNGVLWAAMTPDGRSIVFYGIPSGTSWAEMCVWNSQSHALTSISAASLPSESWPAAALCANGQKLALLGNPVSVVSLVSNTVASVGSSGVFHSHTSLGLSQDGRFLTFAMATNAQLSQNVYLYDLQAKTNMLVSQNFSTRIAGNTNSDSPVISPNGRFIAYRSFATNLVPATYSGAANVFLYDTSNHVTLLLSVNATSAASADDRSLNPQFSADSQMLYFQSWASDICGNDFNNAADLFAIDLTALAPLVTGSGTTNNPSAVVVQLLPSSGFNPAPTLSWTLAIGENYQAQYKTNLTDPYWLNLPGGGNFIGGAGYVSDPSPSAIQRFYRLTLTP